MDGEAMKECGNCDKPCEVRRDRPARWRRRELPMRLPFLRFRDGLRRDEAVRPVRNPSPGAVSGPDR